MLNLIIFITNRNDGLRNAFDAVEKDLLERGIKHIQILSVKETIILKEVPHDRII